MQPAIQRIHIRTGWTPSANFAEVLVAKPPEAAEASTPGSLPLPCLMNTNPHATLAEALRERLTVIADRDAYNRDAAAHLERLKSISERIESLQKQLPPPVDPQLAHFLQRCSYDKALQLLEQYQTT